jgi:hypothetical protein
MMAVGAAKPVAAKAAVAKAAVAAKAVVAGANKRSIAANKE